MLLLPHFPHTKYNLLIMKVIKGSYSSCLFLLTVNHLLISYATLLYLGRYFKNFIKSSGGAGYYFIFIISSFCVIT